MPSYTLDVVTTLVTEECCTCGITFAMTLDFKNHRREDHANFYCPAGHAQHYTAESETQKLTRQLRSANSRLTHTRDQLEATERSLSAQKGVTTKLRKRIAAGACPCCHRNFQNLARHMAGQHPDYGKD